MNSPNATAVRWLLLASLGLNIALLSGLAVHAFEHGRPPHHEARTAMGRGEMLPHPMLLRRVLSGEREAVADAVMRKHRDGIRRALRARADARAEVHAVLSATALDRPALDRAFAALRARDAEAATAVQAMLAELMGELTPAEREAVVEGMRRRHPSRAHDR